MQSSFTIDIYVASDTLPKVNERFVATHFPSNCERILNETYVG